MNDNIDLIYDIIHECCLVYYRDLKLNYIDSLIKISNDINDDFNPGKLTDTSIKKLVSLYKKLKKIKYTNEELRIAFSLLNVMCFKMMKYNLDKLIPDSINYLFIHIIKVIFNNQKLSILDTNTVTNNMLHCLFNNLENLNEAYSLVEDNSLCNLAFSQSQFFRNNITYSYQMLTQSFNKKVDLVFGDISYIDKNSFLIRERLNNLDNGYFIYLISNDFFKNIEVNIFKEIQKEATLLGIIQMPKSFFSENHIGLSVLIGKKELIKKDLVLVDYGDGKDIIQKIKLIISKEENSYV